MQENIYSSGTYVYKATGDVYSGSWVNGKKVGKGTYQFGADLSMMTGTWLSGDITEGQWVSGVYCYCKYTLEVCYKLALSLSD